jgi:hypothetical protein
MGDYPDIFTDGYSVTVGPFGVTFTLLRSEGPDAAGSPTNTNAIVARVRMSRDLAEHLIEATRNTIAQSKAGVVGPPSGKTN